MAQFDVFRLADGSLVLDCQSDLIDSYETRIVVPLIEDAPEMRKMARLHPSFTVDGHTVAMVTQFMTAVRTRELRSPVASLADQHHRIIDAIDVLTGTG